MRYSVGFWILSLMYSSAQAQDVAENPWLREHFTATFKSREAFRLLDRIRKEDSIRRAVWDRPFAKLIKSISPRLPENVRISRTFLRCKLLGWEYGGHWLDVLSMNPIAFEAKLAENDIFLEIHGERGLLKATKDNLLVLGGADGNTVASLYVPGGYVGTKAQIRDCLLRSLQRNDEDSDEADWTLSFKPKKLLEKGTWDAISQGLATASQSRDVESQGEGSLRLIIGSLLNNSIQLFASDVERCQLSAFLDENDRSGTLRLSMDVIPDSKLATFVETAARYQNCQGSNSEPDASFPLIGVAAFRADNDTAQCLQKLQQPAWGNASPDAITHIVFGLKGVSQTDSELFFAFCESPNEPIRLSGSVVQSAFSVRTNAAPQIRLLEPQQVDQSPALCKYLMSLRDSKEPDLIEGNPDSETPERGWLVASCSVSQLAHFFYPDQTAASDSIDDQVRLAVTFSNRRLTLTARMPPRTEKYIYLVFEQVLHSLQSAGKLQTF